MRVPRFTEDPEMAQAVISHVEEAWQPREFRIWRRRNAAQEFGVEAFIRRGERTGDGGNGPTRGVAVCQAALFLAANRSRCWDGSRRSGDGRSAAPRQGTAGQASPQAAPFPRWPMAELPTGTVTFLFTDIEGSTRLWEEHPDAMRQALVQHDDLLRACIESCSHHVFKTAGDAFCAGGRQRQ